MSSRSKNLLKQPKSKHKKEQPLNTADDYQAAGVDFEDSAGKWRAGDAARSMRFFGRALEIYDQGLQKFPSSFDLAYNKARVQLELATHPILVKQLDQPVLTVLQAALESHRYALNLKHDNTDTLFNTSQVLTGIAEELTKSNVDDDGAAIRYLEEALELQNRCLSLQELRYEDAIAQQRASEEISTDLNTADDDDDEGGGAPLESRQESEEQWVSIEEPVTYDTLIDTALAQLGTLTTLCSILSASPGVAPEAMLAWVEEYSSKILNKQLPFYAKDKRERLGEIALVKCNFVSALLEAGFRAGKLDIATYKRERDGVFQTPELELATSVDGLIANSRSLMSFNLALAESRPDTTGDYVAARWNALSTAITGLAAASKLATAASEDVVTSHFSRGDCSMSQYRMGLPPTSYQSAITNASQLLKNAEVFYRNASKLSGDRQQKAAAGFRSALAHFLQHGDKSALSAATQGRSDTWVIDELEDMILEGHLPTGFQIS